MESEKVNNTGKIAVASTGNSLDSFLSEQMGRCQFFIIIDPATMEFEAVENIAEKLQSGAGPKAAELIIGKGAKVLLAGSVGDKAEAVLKKGNIKIVDGFKGTMKVEEVIKNYLSA